MRPDADMQSLAALKPSFVMMGEQGGFDAVAIQAHPEIERVNHVHHAGNSSGIVDGAAAVLIGNSDAGAKLGRKPRGKIRAFANIGSEPGADADRPRRCDEKAVRPQPACRSRTSTSSRSTRPLPRSCCATFRPSTSTRTRSIPNGGAIALGHPLGATGAMILGTALDELERTDKTLALVTLCIGAGMGTATIIERV